MPVRKTAREASRKADTKQARGKWEKWEKGKEESGKRRQGAKQKGTKKGESPWFEPSDRKTMVKRRRLELPRHN